MSVMAVGPALDLDGPIPVAPQHSLLNTRVRTPGGSLASVVVERDATRVLNGVNVWGYPSGCSELWEPCSDGTFRVKTSTSTQPSPRFDSYVVYKPINCSAIGLSNTEAEKLNDRIENVLEATLSGGIEEAMAAGVTGSSNPFFGDGDVTVLAGGSAVSPGIGLSYLEQAIGDTCREGMIHATPAVIASLQAFPLGDQEDTRLITANGTPVVSGMGYQGIDTPFLSTPGATQDWVFATGPVQIYLGPIVTHTVKESLDRSDNDLVLRAERYVVSIWDTALQAAVLVDWAT